MPVKISGNKVILVDDKLREKEIGTIGGDDIVNFTSVHYKRTYKGETTKLLKDRATERQGSPVLPGDADDQSEGAEGTGAGESPELEPEGEADSGSAGSDDRDAAAAGESAGTELEETRVQDSPDAAISTKLAAEVPTDTGDAPGSEEESPGTVSLPVLDGDMMQEEPLPLRPEPSKHFGTYTKEWLLWDAFNMAKEAFVSKWGGMRERNKKHYAQMYAWVLDSPFADRFKAILALWKF